MKNPNQLELALRVKTDKELAEEAFKERRHKVAQENGIMDDSSLVEENGVWYVQIASQKFTLPEYKDLYGGGADTPWSDRP